MSVVNGKLNITSNFTQAGVLSRDFSLPLSKGLNLTYDASSPQNADKCNLTYLATLTFVASTTQTLNLQSLTDIFGNAISFARVRSIEIYPKSTTDGATLTIAKGASTGFTGLGAAFSVTMPASKTAGNDALFVVGSPNATAMVVGASTKNLDLTPSAHAFDVDIRIVGSSA